MPLSGTELAEGPDRAEGPSASPGSEVTAQSKRLAEGSPCPLPQPEVRPQGLAGRDRCGRSPSTTSQALELWSPVLSE